MSNIVRVELGDFGNIIRIFRKDKRWLQVAEDRLALVPKIDAVREIRMQIFKRSCGKCEFDCGNNISWDSMELHEKIPRGKHGEISLQNSVALCHNCHTGSPDSAHGDRRWQTSKIKDPNVGF